MVPVYLTNAIFATSIMISIFFVIRKLFGFLPGILSAFLLIFSMRDIMPYLWGQWPERFGYAFIPLILYCFYMYYTSDEKKSSLYIYLMAVLLGIQVMIHPLSFFHSLAAIFVLFAFLAIKLRKIKFNMNHIAVSLLILILLFAIFPYQSGNVYKSFTKKSTKKAPEFTFSRIFEWGPDQKDFEGSVPPGYFSFKDMHGMWTLPFLLAGLLILALRRETFSLCLSLLFI